MAKLTQPIAFSFPLLCEVFNQICPDFQSNNPCENSQSLGFATKVLFELGPSMRQVKQSGEDQMWHMTLDMKCMDSDRCSTTNVYVYTYRFRQPTNVQPKVRNNKLYLTLKQAALLAVSKLCRVTPLDAGNIGAFVLTPLAMAVFRPQSIPKLALHLTKLLKRDVSNGEVARVIISSCQTDGFHLEHSACHVAVVAVYTTVADGHKREAIRAKTVRLYKKHGKEFDAEQYEIYAKYSKLPAMNLKYEELDQQTCTNTTSENTAGIVACSKPNLEIALHKIFMEDSSLEIKPIDFNFLKLTQTKMKNPYKPPENHLSAFSNYFQI